MSTPNMAKWLSAAGLALTSVSGLLGCATTTAQGQPTTAQSATAAPAKIKNELTVENLLRWPLEGPDGIDKTMANLRQAFELQELSTGELYGQAPITLADGHVLGSTTFSPKFGDIHVGVKQQPCFSPERAVAAIGATLNPVVEDAHGVDRGRTYDARRNGVWVNFTTTPVTYRCVDSIHIHPIREQRP